MPSSNIHSFIKSSSKPYNFPVYATTSFSMPGTGLLLVDIQQGLNHPTYWGTQRSTPNFETNITKLLSSFRITLDTHILHVCHHSTFESSPLHPSKPGVAFMDFAAPLPSEAVFSKTTSSPFTENGLEQVIKDLELDVLVVAGLTTAHCVSTTVRLASNLRVVDHPYGSVIRGGNAGVKGDLVLVSDATATFSVSIEGREFDAETVHRVHLATMKDEFCAIQTTEEVLRRLLGY